MAKILVYIITVYETFYSFRVPEYEYFRLVFLYIHFYIENIRFQMKMFPPTLNGFISILK